MSVTRPARHVHRASNSIARQNTLVENEFQVVYTCFEPGGSRNPREVFTETVPA